MAKLFDAATVKSCNRQSPERQNTIPGIENNPENTGSKETGTGETWIRRRVIAPGSSTIWMDEYAGMRHGLVPRSCHRAPG
jgi:hypothetical protein